MLYIFRVWVGFLAVVSVTMLYVKHEDYLLAGKASAM